LERRHLAEANELSSNSLKGVKLHLFDRCKTTPVPKVYFLTPFPTQEGHPVCKNCHGCWFIGGDDLTGALHDL